MQSILRHVWAEFPQAHYRTHQWMSASASIGHLSRALRERVCEDPEPLSDDAFETDEDPYAYRPPGVDASGLLEYHMHMILSYLFSIAIDLRLDVDRGWRSWCYKVRRKRYDESYPPPVGAVVPPSTTERAADPSPSEPPSGSGSNPEVDGSSDPERARRNVTCAPETSVSAWDRGPPVTCQSSSSTAGSNPSSQDHASTSTTP